jgi:hypothetical protein
MLMPDEQDLSESYDTCDVFHTFAIPSFRIRSFPANFLSWTGVLNPTVIRTFVVTAVVKADLLLRQALNFTRPVFETDLSAFSNSVAQP